MQGQLVQGIGTGAFPSSSLLSVRGEIELGSLNHTVRSDGRQIETLWTMPAEHVVRDHAKGHCAILLHFLTEQLKFPFKWYIALVDAVSAGANCQPWVYVLSS